MTDSLYRGTGGHNYIQETMTDFIKQQQEEAELAVFWDEIAQNLPKSIERNALGDEKIFRAFATTYPKIKAQIIKNTCEEIKRQYFSHTNTDKKLIEVVEDIINNKVWTHSTEEQEDITIYKKL